MALIKCAECGNEVSTEAESCPKCGAKPKKKASRIVRYGGRFIALAVIVPAIFSIIYPDNSSRPAADVHSGGGSYADSAQGGQSPQFSTTAIDLENSYSQNTVSADNRFKGKRFTIKGYVSAITTDMFNHADVEFFNPQNEFMPPHAVLADSERQKAAGLHKGQQISMVCTGDGDIAQTPMLKDCVLP